MNNGTSEMNLILGCGFCWSADTGCRVELVFKWCQHLHPEQNNLSVLCDVCGAD